jgi:NAD(P)-dependent dehydrogenase (short-subunit alcohol dehydrogenase family)
MEAYMQSKLCNILFTHELVNRLDDHRGVTVHSVSPGIVLTDLGRHFRSSYGYWSAFKYYIAYPLMKFIFRTPKEGAQTTVYVAGSEEKQITF